MKTIDLMLDFFKFLCVAIAGFMVGYWFYKFHKNEDISVIEYKPFKDSENTLYPELNFCLFDHFSFWQMRIRLLWLPVTHTFPRPGERLELTSSNFHSSSFPSHLHGSSYSCKVAQFTK